jgi:16S rRNA (cytidine1402-2'-O)-methyltransferase
VDAVYAEDTRVTRKLFTRYGVATPLVRCDENVIAQRAAEAVGRLCAGASLAYVTDAGTPAISDPGAKLVREARAAGVAVEVVAGPSALTAAVSGCGLDASRILFVGFLPRKKGERLALLERLARVAEALGESVLIVAYESARRTLASLADIAEVFKGQTVCVAREITKVNEEFLVAPAEELLAKLAAREAAAAPTPALRGEVVILIEARPADPLASPADHALAETRASELRASGEKRSQIAKKVASEFALPREEAYRLAE